MKEKQSSDEEKPAQLELLEDIAPANSRISKSKFLSAWQCHKLFWHTIKTPDMIDPPSKATRALFEQGQKVGELARSLFPDGIKLPFRRRAHAAHKETITAMQKKRPLFEAGLIHEGAYAIADILLPLSKDYWKLVEVKSTTSVKAAHIIDIAYQYFIFKSTGISLSKCAIMHINRSYERDGELALDKLFTEVDVTKEVKKLLPKIKKEFDHLQRVIKKRQPPLIAVGRHCFSPYPCPLFDHCWNFLPQDDVERIIHLHRGREKALELVAEKVFRIQDIPEEMTLSRTQRIQKGAVVAGKEYFNPANLKNFLNKIEYPYHFFDLESFQTAAPLFDGCRPYQQIPFQFSLHIKESADGDLQHFSYLANGQEDPRENFLTELNKSLRPSGSIIAYNADFEGQRLEELAQAFPQFKKWIQGLLPRLVDLHQPFARFDYYHPQQKGSTSMKQVLPVLTGRTYDALDIQDGHAASLEYLRITYQTEPKWLQKKIRQQLLDYCAEDTLGMVAILRALSCRIAGNPQ